MLQSLRYALIITVLFFFGTSNAATIKGHVYDVNTREQITGARVEITGIDKKLTTGLDGSFVIKNVAPGTYSLRINGMGYKRIDTSVTITTDEQVLELELLQRKVTKELAQVEVVAKSNGGSDAYASNKEKNAINIMNVLSAKAIQLSPDITVSEVMQRVSGVSVESGNSGGQYAVIRGMDKRYNTTLVNGVKIPSPDNRDRYVPLDMFPAELLERLEVIKSPTPSMEADATGGSINMVMKNAPDKLLLEGNLAGGYNTAFQSQDFQKYSTADLNKKSPAEILGPGVYAPVSSFPRSSLITTNLKLPINANASLSVGNRFFKNKLGVVLSGSYQNTYSGYNANVFVENVVSAPSKDMYTSNLPGFSDIEHRTYSLLSKRAGIIAKVDYRINSKNTISLFATHIQLDQYRTRIAIDSIPGGSTFNNTWTNVIGVKYKTETRTVLQGITNITLQGTHKIINDLTADWSLVASQAKRQLPNDAQFSYASKLDIVTDPVTNVQSYTLGNPYYPYVTGQTSEWQHNTDKDLAGYLNLHYMLATIPLLRLIDIGGLYRQKNRDNYDNRYSLNQTTDATGYQQFTSIEDAKLQFTRTTDALGNAAGNAGIYTFSENLLALYGQLHIDVGNKFRMLGGVRMENTIQSYNSSLPVTIAGQHASYNYTDILPGIQGKYDITPKGGIRFSYFKSLYRPAYADLIPFPDQSSNETYNMIGNPYLLHSVIHNMDVRYELFPKGLDQLMVGAFYKSILDPIEYAVVPQTKTDLILQPENFGNAKNYGFELVGRKYLGNFGLSGSYTYTHSSINSDKVVYHVLSGPSDSAYAHVSQSRPLQGQAAHIGNVSLIYNNRRNKIEAQLALVYTGERINTVSYYKDLDVWQKPTLNMDFSAQKQFGKHFIVYLKLKNLLNTGSELFIKQANTAYAAPSKLPYQKSPDYYTIERQYYYSSMLIGLRYKLN